MKNLMRALAIVALFAGSLVAPPASAQGIPVADVDVPGWTPVASTPPRGHTQSAYKGEGNNTLLHVRPISPKGDFQAWVASQRTKFFPWYTQGYNHKVLSERLFTIGKVQGSHLELEINGKRRDVTLAFWVSKDGAWNMLIAYNKGEQRQIHTAAEAAIKTLIK